MFPPLDVRFSINSFFVADRDIQDFEVQLACFKEQVKVTEWIEFSEVGPVCYDAIIAASRNNYSDSLHVGGGAVVSFAYLTNLTN
jgi:hypothetical protein